MRLLDSYFIIIILLSAILFWLRAIIDQQKGVVLEALGVTVPVAIHAVAILINNSGIGLTSLGLLLTPTVVFVFLALPALGAVRLAERLWRGEQPQLADMFRLTTFTAMGTFVVSLLQVDQRAIVFVTLMTLAYLIGDCLRTYPRPGRRISLFALTVVALVVINVIVLNLRLQLPNRDVPLVTELRLSILLGLLSAPLVWHRWLDNSRLFGWLGLWLQAVRMHYVRPEDAISHRTLFRLWHFRPGVCYLNHGSFGAVPFELQQVQNRWQQRVRDEPMDMLARATEPAWHKSRDRLAFWLGSRPENMALCENATAAMNELAGWFPLAAGDEVLLTNHEYGAVKRIWQRRTARSGAHLRYAELPMPVEDPEQIVQAIVSQCTERTRLVVFSHITSPTAIVMPVARLCEVLRSRHIATCIDGPHALLQERVQLERLNCDFYTASCHKWLCAPLGSGFLYINPIWREQVEPLRLSWGRLPPAEPRDWVDQLTWVGSRDYSAYMSIPAAIDFFSKFEYDLLDQRNHRLACYARRVLCDLLGTTPLVPESRELMGWMAAAWLPNGGKHNGDFSWLQDRLWQRYGIEVPIMNVEGRYLVRVSCHLYNTTQDVDVLARALTNELR